MKPIIKGAIAAAVLAAIAGWAQLRAPTRVAVAVQHADRDDQDDLATVCPAGSIPDRGHCVPFPRSSGGPTLPEKPSRLNAGFASEELIPLRPDRSAAYSAYVMPVAPNKGEKLTIRPVNIGKGIGLQPTGIELKTSAGDAVRALTLQGQRGGAEVVYVGTLVGESVVTTHVIQQVGKTRRYVVIYGGVHAADGVQNGTKLSAGQVIGTVVSPSGALVLQIRQVRAEVTFTQLRSPQLMTPSVSIPCDARNVLALHDKSSR